MAIRVKAFLFFFLLIAIQTTLAQQLRLPKVDFVCTNSNPADALVKLSKQTGINIAFNDQIFAHCTPINISVKGESFENLLRKITSCAKVSYKIDDSQVVIYRGNYKYTISGYVQDSETGERLIGVSIRTLSDSKAGAITNEFGFFSLKLDEGAYTIAISYIGYQPQTENLLISDNRFLVLQMQADNKLPEVLVKATPSSTPRQKIVGAPKDLPLASLKDLPMPGGEADLLRLTAFQPGVQTGVDGLGGLHVRGGNADQNLFLLDDVPVYSPGHALGLFSIFNPSIISSARLWKGDFPARYGGRVSSVLDIRTRDGNFRKYESSASAGLFATTVSTEGPIIKEKCSYLIGARTTYFEPWVDFFSKRGNLLNISGDLINYRFYDANIKLNYIFSEKDRVYFSYYKGNDFFKNRFDQNYTTTRGLITDKYTLNSNWGNVIAAFRWNHVWSKNLFSNTTLRYSRFIYQSRLGFNSNIYYATGKEAVLSDYAQLYQTLIRDWSGKTDFTYYMNPTTTLRWGVSYTAHEFQPGALSANFLQPGQSPGAIDSLTTLLVNNQLLEAGEAESYIDIEFEPIKHFKIETGLNGAFFLQSKNSSYKSLQPRIKLALVGAHGWELWGGFYRNTQFLHQIGTFNISLPFELWVPSTRTVKPEQVWQVSIGTGWERRGWGWQIEAYYKKLQRVLTFISNNEALYTGGAEDASGWEDRIASGEGKSRGIEMLFERNTGKTTGSIAYTLSESDRLFPDLNSGRRYPFRFDRRHDLKLTVRQQVTHWLNISGIWSFATGNPITLAGVKFKHESVEGEVERDIYVYTEVNGYRLPNYHRFDIALNIKFFVQNTQHLIQLGAYNSYNRSNPFFLYVDGGSNIQGRAIQYTLLPVLPSFRYQVKF
jgi:hypothetical protein